MLRLCSKEEFYQYADYAYELATDLTKSGYPTYCDGIKTKEMFMERSLKAFDRETEQILLYETDGEIQGLIHYYWIPKDYYLDTCLFLINKGTEQALSEFLSYVGERHQGYDLFLGFPCDNHSAVRFLSSQGFDCIENTYNNTAFLERLDHIPVSNDIIKIGKENYKLFQVIHSQIEGDMYWNSERIYLDLENWSIYVKEKDGKPQGAVYYINVDDGWYEVFGIDIDQNAYNPELFKELLSVAMYGAKLNGGKIMTFFCDEKYEKAAIERGFQCIGNYLCYKTHLN